MNEIKYKVWDIEYKKWRDDSLALAVGRMSESAQRQGYILVEYTRCRDVNGLEIYDGDILIKRRKLEGGGNHMKPFLVHWQPDRCGWNVRNMPNIGNPIYYEKLGNIYENPELLNKKGLI